MIDTIQQGGEVTLATLACVAERQHAQTGPAFGMMTT